MYKTYKVMLLPNNKQNTKLFACAGVSRFAYNWTLDFQQTNHNNGNKFVNDIDLRRIFTQLKKEPAYQWLSVYSNNITKQAIKDACNAYKRFFSKKSEFPKFKSKKKSKPSFFVDPEKISFTNGHVKLEKLTTSKKANKQKFNLVKLAEKNRIPINSKYANPHVTFDGLHWWLSVSVEETVITNNNPSPKAEGIGIDLGIKDLAICSDGNTYKNINKSKAIKKLKKKHRRLQRQLSRKYEQNKQNGKSVKTHNIEKQRIKLLKVTKRLQSIRHNYINQMTTEIMKRNPSFIVLEDLNVKGMMKNRHLAKAIQEQCFYEVYRQLEYKSKWLETTLITANRWYPSSKLCSKCGYIHKDLKLKVREYVCPQCNNHIDRDFQAAYNLYTYGIKHLAS